jgi:hypothetical protein
VAAITNHKIESGAPGVRAPMALERLRMKRIICVSLLVLVFHSLNAQAADKYLRKGASGTGTSWADAYGELNSVSWSGMSGFTLWIAAGSYTQGFPSVSIPNVTIRRATVSSHGTSTGWADSYDNQVTVTPNSGTNFLVIGSGADSLVLDGVAYNPWKFRVAGVRGYNGMLRNDGADNVVIRGIEFDGMAESTASGGPEDGLRWMGGTNDIIEHNYIHDYQQVSSAHNDGVQGPSCTNITFRYNVFKNNGMHLFLGDYAWGTQYCNGITIDHNIFYNDSNGGSYNSIVFKGTNLGGSYTNKIENNVFNLRGQGSVFYLADSPSPGCCNNLANGYFRNNIVYSSAVGNVGYYSHSYNTYYNSSGPSETAALTSNPLFTDVASNNYSLQATSPAIGSGMNLGYTQDIAGTSIPSTSPDRGPYEYIGATTAVPPGPATNLRIIR